jgi:mannose-6-phosphate isomerase class I
MGFYINPVRFEDFSARNTLPVIDLHFVAGSMSVLMDTLQPNLKPGLIVIDGYVASQLDGVARALASRLKLSVTNIAELLKPKEEIAQIISPFLPQDRLADPDLIFAKLFSGTFEEFLDNDKVNDFLNTLSPHGSTILFGLGAAAISIAQRAANIIFIDCTPYKTALRITDQEYTPIGGQIFTGFDGLLRQTYFVDIELVTKNRRRLLQENLIDYYISDEGPDNFKLLSLSDLKIIANLLASQPMRPKPIYIEGVWGGQYLKKIRKIPDSCADKVAWSFELIATEASIAVDFSGNYLDIPFLTLMDLVGDKLVGSEDYINFKGYFPVRFNYDDTWHSNGNMSIQCHPDDNMVRTLYNDYAGQSEAYYIVEAGQHARTFCGFKGDGRKFLELAKHSEKKNDLIDYEYYVNAVKSTPGRQFFLPSGTIHSSGRNQLVLELGSLTVSAYTYKIYDYTRMDITGKPRPIHTKLSELALHFERDSKWVSKNLVFDPHTPVSTLKNSSEFLLGKSPLVPFETSQIELMAGGVFEGETKGRFVGLSLVDGEEITISSIDNPDKYYTAKYLDVVIIPACLGRYRIQAGKNQPAIVHKTIQAGR